jgi:DNA polymerase-3 subunit gamma/tau
MGEAAESPGAPAHASGRGADSSSAGGLGASGRPGGGRRYATQHQPADEPPHDPDRDVDPDTDGTVMDSPTSHTELLAREFGAEVIEELPAT